MLMLGPRTALNLTTGTPEAEELVFAESGQFSRKRLRITARMSQNEG